MKLLQRSIVVGLSALTLTAALTYGSASASPGGAGQRAGGDRFTFALIGDIPYGDAQIASFPDVVKQINADPAVQLVDHLGDIKSGSTPCSNAYFARVKADFDTFVDPLVYTVGDNEWTDCHRVNNGSYNPLERLAKIRSVFFSRPGYTMGRHAVPVTSQASLGIPEDVRYTRGNVAFAALHVVGSNNGTAPWTGSTGPTVQQSAEVASRTAAVIKSIRATFDRAREEHNRSVVLMMQADMFDPTVPNPAFADYSAFRPIIAAIAKESAAFRGPVYLFDGDSHVYNSDKPLAQGSKWLSFYGIARAVPNLSRVTVDGSTGVNSYLRVTVDPHNPAVLSWVAVPFTP